MLPGNVGPQPGLASYVLGGAAEGRIGSVGPVWESSVSTTIPFPVRRTQPCTRTNVRVLDVSLAPEIWAGRPCMPTCKLCFTFATLHCCPLTPLLHLSCAVDIRLYSLNHAYGRTKHCFRNIIITIYRMKFEIGYERDVLQIALLLARLSVRTS